MTSFGDRIKDARLALGLTQKQVADQAGVGKQYIANVEGGWETPKKPETIEAIAAALHLDSDLLYLDAERTPPDIDAWLRTGTTARLAAVRKLMQSDP